LTIGDAKNKTPDQHRRSPIARRCRRWIRVTAIIIVALVGFDYLSGFFYQTNQEAQVTIIKNGQGTVRRAIVILPGYLMSGSIVGQAFRPYLKPGDAIVTVDYAQRGVDVKVIYRKIYQALEALKPREVRFYGASMGGLVARGLLHFYEQDHLPFGKITLVLDTALSGEGSVKQPDWLLSIGCIYHGGLLSTVFLALASSFGGHPPSSTDANPGLVRKAHESGTWAGMPAAASQACFIRDSPPLRRNELVSTARQVIYLHGQAAEEDPLVDVGVSIRQWRIAFPQLRSTTLEGRAGRWHVPLVEQPQASAPAALASY
jgi:hypothetical protein